MNVVNAGLLFTVGILSYLMTPYLIGIADSYGIDTLRFDFYSRFFPALTVLFIFVTNGLFFYSSPKVRSHTSRLMMLPAFYLVAANVFALLLPFGNLPEAQEPIWSFALLTLIFSLLMPILEARRYFSKDKKTNGTANEHLPEADGLSHLSDLPEAERNVLTAASHQNYQPFNQPKEQFSVRN